MKRYWRLILAFLFYTFYYLIAELKISEYTELLLGGANAVVLYGISCFSVAIGLCLFSPIYQRLKTAALQRRMLIFVLIINLICTASVPFAKMAWMFVIVSILAALTAGYIGAALLYNIAVSVEEKNIIGKLIAISYAPAFLLQYIEEFVSGLFGKLSGNFTIGVIIAAMLAAVCLLLSYKDEAPSAIKEINDTKQAKATSKYIWGALIGGIIIFCLYGLNDGIIMTLHTGKELSVFGFVRLLCIPALFLAGFIADFKDRRLFPFASLIAMLAMVISVFLFQSVETYNIALGCVYFFASFMTMYSLVIFVEIATETNNPALWASVGRALKYAAGGIFVFVGSFAFSNMSYYIIAVIYLSLLIALFVIFFLQGKLYMEKEKAPEPYTPKGIEQYRFTERENEVLGLLIKGFSTAEIAGSLFVSDKTVRNHISNMLIKTDCHTRSDLLVLVRDCLKK